MVDKLEALRRTVLFGGLDERELAALAERAVELRLERGNLLFVAGESPKGLYVVVEGAVRAYRESLEGREQIIHIERGGATVAEVPVFDDRPAPSSVAAEEATTLLFIDKRDVRRLCLEHPQIALAALQVLASRLRKCSELVAMLSLHDVGQRVACLLLSEARERGARDGGRIRFTLDLTKEQIAMRVGSVREVVSRALTRLQQDGLVEVDGREVTILDERAFRGFCER